MAFSERDVSSTFARGMAVLRAFDDTHARLTLAQIARLTELDRAAVRRLVLTLVQLGYAKKTDRHYSLTPKVLTLAGSFLRGNQFGTQVQPLLDRHAAQAGRTVSLAIIDGLSAVYVAQSTLYDSDISLGFTVGSRLPLLPTAIGTAILAASDRAQLLLRDAPLERFTDRTTLDRGEIGLRVERCRQDGFAIVDGEFEHAVSGFAVPIAGADPVAAVGTSMPSRRARGQASRGRIIDGLRQLADALARVPAFAPR